MMSIENGLGREFADGWLDPQWMLPRAALGAAFLGPVFQAFGRMDVWWTWVFLGLLLFPAAEDGATGYLSDGWSMALGVAGAVHSFLTGQGEMGGFFLVMAVLGGLYLARPDGIGGGDLLLGGAISLWLSLPGAAFFLWLAFVTGGAAGAFLLLARRRTVTEGMPFGPFLCLGGGIAYVLEEQTAAWAARLFG